MTALETTTSLTPLDKHLLDADCANYLQWRILQEEAKQKADTIKARIQAAVDQHGYVPTNAEKSRRIECQNFIATITSSIGVEVNDAKVVELELVLAKARCSRMFPALFVRRVEYSLAPTYNTAIATTPWPKKHAEEIQRLAATSFRPVSRTPSLTVERREVVQERERIAAEKAARKAAKTAKAGKVAA
jgi:hypothetical protein